MSPKLRKSVINTIIAIFYLVVAILVIPYEGQNLAYSMFYQSSRAVDTERNLLANSQRVSEAERTLEELQHEGRDYLYLSTPSTKSPEFCFVIVSVSRLAPVHYLTQVVASLLPQIAHSDSVFAVLNAEGPTHVEAVNLSSLIPVLSLARWGKSLSKYANEKEDYTNALDWCLSKHPKFSVVFQDDALPPPDFLGRLRFILKYRAPTDVTKWALLKLYYPEKWEGWANERRIITELIITSIVGGVLFTAVTYLIQLAISRSCTSISETFNAANVIARFLLSFCLTLYMLLSLGRPHWLALRKVSVHLSSVVTSPGCCTPAVVYPLDHISDIVEHLRDAKTSVSVPIDLELDAFAKKEGLENLLVVPNLVRHIGFVSSLGKGWHNPREFRI